MISDREAARLCAATYGGPPEPWAHWDDGGDPAGVAWGLRRYADCDVVAMRGSITMLDWRRDFDAWAAPDPSHPGLGPVHPGFLAGMAATWAEMRPFLREHLPTILVGHSLGAARTVILAGLMILDGRAPTRRVTFGEPRGCYQPLADMIVRSGVSQATYRNGDDRHHDMVTDVAYPIPAFGLAYVRACDFTIVCAPPPPSELGPFAWHHMLLYEQAMLAISGE